MPRTAVATDNFNRASLDANWGQLNGGNGGNVLIDSSTTIKGQYTLQPTDQSCAARWVGSGTFTDDQFSSVKMIIPALNNPICTVGAIARAGAGTNNARTYYEFYCELNTSSYSLATKLTKWVAGTRTVLASGNVTWASGDTIDIEVIGTTVRGCRNGVALGAPFIVTDSSITTGLPGVTIAGGAAMFADDWSAGSVTAPTVLAWTGTIGAQTGTVGTAITALATSSYVSGGTTPYIYSATGLPLGLSISSSAGLITGTPTTAGGYTVTVSVTDSAGTPATVSGAAFSWTISAAAATAITMTGPSGGQTGVASANFTVGGNGAISGSHVVTLSSGGGGGTFTPATVTLTAGSPTGTFTYTPSSTGAKTISAADAGGYSAPAALTYTSAAAAGTFTSEALKDNTGTVLASIGLTHFTLYDDTTGALVVRRTGLSTNGSGVVSFSDGALLAGAYYKPDWLTVGGHYRMPRKAAT